MLSFFSISKCFVLIFIRYLKNTQKKNTKKNLQLRVIRAFRSTLEDLEERRSVHSLHSLRSLRSHPNMAYFNMGTQKNLSPFAAHQQYQQQLMQRSGLQSTAASAAAAMSSNLPDMSYIDEDNGAVENGRGQKSNYNDDLTRPVHETRI